MSGDPLDEQRFEDFLERLERAHQPAPNVGAATLVPDDTSRRPVDRTGDRKPWSGSDLYWFARDRGFPPVDVDGALFRGADGWRAFCDRATARDVAALRAALMGEPFSADEWDAEYEPETDEVAE